MEVPMMRNRLVRAGVLAGALSLVLAGGASAHPANDNTLVFTLTCDDGQVWTASFNGGPAAFHLEGDGLLYIGKQFDYVTPDGQSGSIEHGIQGFAGAPTVVCTYTGAISGNAYTVTGFYTPAR
jgi:hypothetical protein